MKVMQSPLSDLLIIEPKIFADSRGLFYETYHENKLIEYGITKKFKQDNFSKSTQGVLRGLHFQLKKPQAKLVQVTQGEVFDVAVDIRKSSPTFGKWFGTILSEFNHLQLYIPEGFAHGFYVLSETAYFQYKCSDFYDPSDEKGVLWNDPTIGIDWPFQQGMHPILSAKDLEHPLLKEISSKDLPE